MGRRWPTQKPPPLGPARTRLRLLPVLRRAPAARRLCTTRPARLRAREVMPAAQGAVATSAWLQSRRAHHRPGKWGPCMRSGSGCSIPSTARLRGPWALVPAWLVESRCCVPQQLLPCVVTAIELQGCYALGLPATLYKHGQPAVRSVKSCQGSSPWLQSTSLPIPARSTSSEGVARAATLVPGVHGQAWGWGQLSERCSLPVLVADGI